MSTDQATIAQDFSDRYGRYFGEKRLDGMKNLGFMVIEAPGEGAYFVDTGGRRILDFWCTGGVHNLGHRNPVLVEAAVDAIRELDFGSLFFLSEAKGRLAETLAKTTPAGLEVTIPVVTGSEGVDNACKMARGSTGRTEILYANNAYHGITGFALSMMHPGPMRDFAEPLVPGFRSFEFGDIDSLADTISDQTAAVVMEPLQNDSGHGEPPKGFFPAVRDLCDRHGAKLIIDEVVSGMGRLGTLWGSEREDVVPDMLVTAKGFSGGMYPMAALVVRPDVIDFWESDPYRTMSSYAWSNPGAVVSRVAIEETQRLLPEANAMGDRLDAVVNDFVKRFPSVLEASRRAGMMWLLDFADAGCGFNFMSGMMERDVMVCASSQNLQVPKLFPPLILGDAEIADFAGKAEDCLKSLV
ncbi:MAG: aspartate aminotransferase family protein [bacterium]|nr:aspartate aminotransferase family protein [bacterium]